MHKIPHHAQGEAKLQLLFGHIFFLLTLRCSPLPSLRPTLDCQHFGVEICPLCKGRFTLMALHKIKTPTIKSMGALAPIKQDHFLTGKLDSLEWAQPRGHLIPFGRLTYSPVFSCPFQHSQDRTLTLLSPPPP